MTPLCAFVALAGLFLGQTSGVPIAPSPVPTPPPVVNASPAPIPGAAPTPTLSSATSTSPAPTPGPPATAPLAVPTSVPAPVTSSSGNKEEWDMVFIKGKAFGYQHEAVTELDGKFTMVRHEETVLNRAGSHLRSIEDSTLVEDDQGKVLSFEKSYTRPESSGQITGERVGENFVIHAEGTPDETEPCPKGALGPAAVERTLQGISLAPGSSLEISEFSPSHVKVPTAMKIDVLKKEDHLIDQKTQSLWQVRVTEGSSEISFWMDDNHKILSQETTIPGMGTLVIEPSTQAVCKEPIDGIELFSSSMIHPNRSLDIPSRHGRVDYLLSCPGSTELTLWKDDKSMQEVTKSQPGLAAISVYGDSFVPELAGYMLPARFTLDMKPYLTPSRYLECNSPEIQILARTAAGGSANPVVVARKIETFVRYYITRKDYRLGFLSARATALNREGDCKEHAVLCAAMGRALGIPTRCVLGLCYVPPSPQLTASVYGDASRGVFAFHMWAEAYIGPGQWMPMDAATYGYDAGHIAIFKTALSEDNPDFEAVTPMVGHLSISIVNTDLTSRPLPTPRPTQAPIVSTSSHSVD